MGRFCRMLLLVALVPALGCEQKQNPGEATPGKVTSTDVRRDIGQVAQTTAEFSRQAKEEFQAKFDARLKELDAELATFQEKGRDMKDEAKANWDKVLADLEGKRDAARVKLAEVGQSSQEAWKDVQQGAQAAWDDLDKAFRDASSKF